MALGKIKSKRRKLQEKERLIGEALNTPEARHRLQRIIIEGAFGLMKSSPSYSGFVEIMAEEEKHKKKGEGNEKKTV